MEECATAGPRRIAQSDFEGRVRYKGSAGLAIDQEGNAVLTGTLHSDDLPTTPGAWKPSQPQLLTPFVTRLSRDGEIVSSTLFGGAGDAAHSIAIASNGDAITTGSTRGTSFESVNPVLAPPEMFAPEPGLKGFIARISADATTVRYAFLIPWAGLFALPSDEQAIFASDTGIVLVNLPGR